MLITFLRLRTWLGWGKHPDDLRVRARLYVSMALRLLMLGVINCLFLFGITLAVLWTSNRRSVILSDPVRYAVFLGSAIVLFIVVMLIVPAVSSRILARRAQTQRPAFIYGRCFATIPDPPGYLRLFARIGPSQEKARWYVLPLEWDTFIEPSPTELELTVIEGCGCVERLRRLGPNPRDLRLPDLEAQEDDDMSLAEMRQAAEDPAAEDPADAAASPEERKSLRAFIRQAGLPARFSPTYILFCAWSILVPGALLGPGFVVASAIAFVLFPESFRDPAGRVAGLIVLGIMLIAGIGCMVYGIHLLRIGRRARATRHELPTVVTGKVVSWMLYRDLWTPGSQTPRVQQGRTETLIRIRLPDGTTPIFCIPKVYLHRVRELGAPVCITYLPSTWRVVDARRLEQPDKTTTAE